MRAPKICPHCSNLQPCPDHTPAPWAGSIRKQTLPHSRAWARIRKRILDRDPVCKVCDNALSTEVDHVVPGDDHGEDNLQGICESCHKAKTQREAASARA